MDCSPPGSSVHGILQAKILEWVAIFFSRGSSRRRNRIRVSCIGRQILYCQATWEALMKPGVLHPWGRRESDMTEQLDNSSAVRFGLCLSLRPYRLSARSHTASRHTVLFSFHILCPSCRSGLQAWDLFVSALRLVSPSPTPPPPSDFHSTTLPWGSLPFPPYTVSRLDAL